MEEIKAAAVDDVCRAAARWSVRRIAVAIEQRGHALLALPGGSSIKPLASALIAALDASPEVQRERITVFLADERVLPAGHTERNDRLIAQLLRSAGATIEHGAYRPPHDRAAGTLLLCEPPIHGGEPETASKRAAATYTEQLERAGGKIDIAILGSGEDGHIASLFPNHALLEREGNGYAVITDSPKPPPTRITLLPESITGARAAVGLFFGEAKRDALRRFLAAREPASSLPTLLMKSIPDRLILTDQVDLIPQS